MNWMRIPMRSMFTLLAPLTARAISALPSLLEDEHDVADIDDRRQPLAEDDHRLALDQAIDQRHQPAAHGENPERERDDAFSCTFARDPLHQETCGEQQLRGQA